MDTETPAPADTEGGFSPELVIEATGRATHPPDVVLDGDGNPLLDDDGEPVRKEA